MCWSFGHLHIPCTFLKYGSRVRNRLVNDASCCKPTDSSRNSDDERGISKLLSTHSLRQFIRKFHLNIDIGESNSSFNLNSGFSFYYTECFCTKKLNLTKNGYDMLRSHLL